MKHILIALLIGIAGILTWTYVEHPTEWQEWKLKTQIGIADLTGQDVAVIQESLFFLRRDELLEKYDQIADEYVEAKTDLEGEFNETKKQIGEKEVGDMTVEQALSEFLDSVAEKKVLFEQRKAEIELEIAEVKRKYEETKAALRDLNDSVKKIQEGAKEGADAVGAIRDMVTEE